MLLSENLKELIGPPKDKKIEEGLAGKMKGSVRLEG